MFLIETNKAMSFKIEKKEQNQTDSIKESKVLEFKIKDVNYNIN
jgi:hypothetical protein